MPDKIDIFDGKHAFLSNFYMTPVVYEGVRYPCSECAFQAAKCADPADRAAFTQMTPGAAKRAGKKVVLRPDWEDVKDSVMLTLLRDKFTRNYALRQLLCETGDAVLIEGNYWHDNYWGHCTCPRCAGKEHKNKLGQLLMQVRSELQHTDA